MRVIHKTISLENFKSRMPSIIPSFDNDGVIRYFNNEMTTDETALVNYGMYPLNVIKDNKLYSYEELVALFHELDAKFSRQVSNDCVVENEDSDEHKMYLWLLDTCFPYFKFDEHFEANQANDYKRVWKTDRLSVKDSIVAYNKMLKLQNSKDECDVKEFNAKGGENVINKLNEWYNNTVKNVIICGIDDNYVYEVNDNDANIIIKTIKKHKNGQIIVDHEFELKEASTRILGDNRYIEYGELDENGMLTNIQNIAIINDKLTIPSLIEHKKYLCVDKPYLSLPLTLNNSMTNLGEMVNLCEDWVEGYGYNSKGVISFYNNDYWILESDDYPGYIYSEKYKEIYFGSEKGMTPNELLNFKENDSSDLKNGYHNSSQWERYFDSFNKITEKINNYTYKDNVLVFNPTDDIMSDCYTIYDNDGKGYGLYKNNLYPLIQSSYIEINGDKYRVYEDEARPYVLIGNKRLWGVLYNGKYVIKQPNVQCILEGSYYEIKVSDKEFYVEYDGKLESDYEKKIAFANVKDTIIYFTKNNKNEFVIENAITNWKQYNIKDNLLYVCEPYAVYDSTKVKGWADSRIDELVDDYNTCYDNLGNKLHGFYPISFDGDEWKYETTIKENSFLSIPYIPQTKFDDELVEENVYWGNLVDKLIFTYDVEEENKKVECNTDDELKEFENDLKNNYKNYANLICYVEYYIGTLFDGNGELIKKNELYYGIKYTSKFNLSLKQDLFYKDEFTPIIVNYWEMKHDTLVYDNVTYDAKGLEAKVSTFEYNIKPFRFDYGFIYNLNENPIFYKVNYDDVYVIIDNVQYTIEINDGKKFVMIGETKYDIDMQLLVGFNERDDKYFDYFNDMALVPMIRKENNLWMASNENVEANIYINRGTNRAIDYHLRLMEAKSLDSLERIGNGFFNVKNNNEF